MLIPTEIWAEVFHHVGDFDSLVSLAHTCRLFRGIVVNQTDEYVVAPATRHLSAFLAPVRSDYSLRKEIPGAGPWLNACLRYLTVAHNLSFAWPQSRITGYVLDEKGYNEDLGELYQIPDKFGNIALVAEFNRQIPFPRSVMHLKSGHVAFPAQLDTLTTQDNPLRPPSRPKIYYPVIDFTRKEVRLVYSPAEGAGDFEVSTSSPSGCVVTELHPREPSSRSWSHWPMDELLLSSNANSSNAPLGLRAKLQYVDMEADDSLLMAYASSPDFTAYHLCAATPKELKWSLEVPVTRQAQGVSTLLATTEYVFAIGNTLRAYRIDSQELVVDCTMPLEFVHYRMSSISSGVALTQTHLLALHTNKPRLYALSLDSLLQNKSADFDGWSLVCDFKHCLPNDRIETLHYKFSEKKFLGRFVSVVWRHALALIDLFDASVRYYRACYDDDLLHGFQTLRIFPRSSCHWIVNESGKVVYISQEYLKQLTEAYLLTNSSGYVAIETFVRPKLSSSD
ncbi:hypothetical protein TRVA0_062S00122 [Trichomonascus vanleenenianus]|uniref:uncharacterized protein n=1 Tax=Trichomonascus vanleenenianus TaxID=2268995 RepID=UPI003EC953C8